MRCGSCGAEALLGSASCDACGASLLGSLEAPPPIEDAAPEPSTAYLPPPPVPVSFDAPPPPPVGWTLADGPGRAALLPAPPSTRPGSTATPLRVPTNKGGCGCAFVAAVICLGLIAAVFGVVASVSRNGPGERLDAPALTLGSEVRFVLGDDDTGVHPLDLGEGAVTITVTSLDDDFDPRLRIVGPGDAVVGENDDADGRNSRLSFTLASAAHLEAEVTEFSGDPGEYLIAVTSGATPPVLDPIDVTVGERVEAEELVLGDAVQRHLGQGDVAVHPLIGFEGRVTITVTGFEGFDPVVRVVDVEGGVVAENDDFDGLDSLVTFVLSPSDRFDVEVREFSGDPGFYSVLLQRGDGESGAAPVLGAVLTRGLPVEGEVGREQAALHDFTGDGEQVVVTVEGQLGFDPVVRVVATNGDELAENDDTQGLDSRVELTIPADETVTVEVTGYDGQPGRYRVLVA